MKFDSSANCIIAKGSTPAQAIRPQNFPIKYDCNFGSRTSQQICSCAPATLLPGWNPRMVDGRQVTKIEQSWQYLK